ncbi:hypothetical protein B0H34DRAFT_270683 [Crassisporium funariophilum]|nr:hypothetical protein B0H34DRAFT_270683 [Crassisporium funariophilum]
MGTRLLCLHIFRHCVLPLPQHHGWTSVPTTLNLVFHLFIWCTTCLTYLSLCDETQTNQICVEVMPPLLSLNVVSPHAFFIATTFLKFHLFCFSLLLFCCRCCLSVFSKSVHKKMYVPFVYCMCTSTTWVIVGCTCYSTDAFDFQLPFTISSLVLPTFLGVLVLSRLS